MRGNHERLRADMNRELKVSVVPWLRSQGFKRSFPLAIAVALIGTLLSGCSVHPPTSQQVSMWKVACRYTKPTEIHKTVKDALEYRQSIIDRDVDINTGQILTERTARTYRCVWTGGRLYNCALTDTSYHPRYEKRYTTTDLYVGLTPSPGDWHQVVRQIDVVDLETGEVLAASAYSSLYSSAIYLGYINSNPHRTCGGELEDNDVFKHTEN
jgi:hypothetical protein